MVPVFVLHTQVDVIFNEMRLNWKILGIKMWAQARLFVVIILGMGAKAHIHYSILK